MNKNKYVLYPRYAGYSFYKQILTLMTKELKIISKERNKNGVSALQSTK